MHGVLNTVCITLWGTEPIDAFSVFVSSKFGFCVPIPDRSLFGENVPDPLIEKNFKIASLPVPFWRKLFFLTTHISSHTISARVVPHFCDQRHLIHCWFIVSSTRVVYATSGGMRDTRFSQFRPAELIQIETLIGRRSKESILRFRLQSEVSTWDYHGTFRSCTGSLLDMGVASTRTELPPVNGVGLYHILFQTRSIIVTSIKPDLLSCLAASVEKHVEPKHYTRLYLE